MVPLNQMRMIIPDEKCQFAAPMAETLEKMLWLSKIQTWLLATKVSSCWLLRFPLKLIPSGNLT